MESNTLNQWFQLGRILSTLRIVTITLSALVLILGLIITYLSFQNPVIIGLHGFHHIPFRSTREKIEISNEDIKEFIRKYLELRYVFKKFDKKLILENLKPICTSGLIEKLDDYLTKTFKDKNIPLSQNIIINEIKVTETDIIASIDRIVTLEKLKVVMPLQISFKVNQESSTEWNPLGLFINGAMEYESN